MRRQPSSSAPAPLLACLLALGCGFVLAPTVQAQQPQLPGSALPQPRLTTVTPPGGKTGTVVEVGFTGTDLEEPEALLFSHPGIKAEPVVPPAPPADPKKPPMPNAPKPPVTKFKVTIAADAPPGIHDVRFVGKWGVSNPRAFVVGDQAEAAEKEPNNDVPEAQRVELNTTVSGAIAGPTDVDFFVFAGKKGQRVLASCLASSIDSRLQPLIEVFDGTGRLLANGRDYDDNDALADVTLPADGDYFVRLCQFTYTQGTPEHFYRLTITTAPWIDAVFPSAVEPGKPAQVTVYGRNLPGGKPDPAAVADGRPLESLVVTVNVPADPQAAQRLAYGGRVLPKGTSLDGFEYRVRGPAGVSNPFLLTYARAPVAVDNGANDTAETAQEVPVPCEIAGRVEKKRDRDWYAFTAKKGDVYNVEILSERRDAPTAMHFVLHNVAAKQAVFEAQPDNPEVLSPKFFAKTEDPAVYKFTAPADGKYQLLVTSRDADLLAGARHLYQVRITPDQPDFRLVVVSTDGTRPDSCNLLQGGSAACTVLVWRRDGFSGEVQLSAEGLPKGVTFAPQVVGTGLRQASLVVTAAADAPAWAGEIKIKGTATIKGQPVVREARAGSINWPVQPQQNIPAAGRLARGTALAVRDKAPYHAVATLDKAALTQGEKATLKVQLTRLWPDFKQPLQVQAQIQELPPNNVLTFNNNQPVTIAADKAEGTLAVDVKANAPPGSYTVVLRTQAQIPFNKDPMAKQKQPLVVVQPSTPVTITVLPKTVAAVAATVANPNVKIGMQTEVVVKVARMYDFAGEFKVQLVLPPNVAGVSAADVTIPAGKDEAKLVVKAAPDAAAGARPDLVVRATALVNGNVPTVQEAKFTVNVVK